MAEKAETLREYQTDQIIIRWSQSRCIHFAACVRGQPDVFDPGKRPWIQVSNAISKDLRDIVRSCPTGALHYEMLTSTEYEKPENENRVFVSPDGPLYLRGKLRLSRETETLEDTRLALCRCGKSENKPFCDGSHSKAKFQDSGALSSNQLSNSATDKSSLTLRPLKNGPLQLEGPFVLSAPAGSRQYQGSAAALCRCGASNRKPFCDGSHSKIDFSAD